ncbi:MAG: tRNA (adenosine(37)-N6)-threonylcarbamoyltransferase complex transferase subunit TsaD [Firmicutes bacterium]|nr:tRNA (adenosine(37)-N6)-threonylcarbamoyltransferase complex transferase subunit TsaD [Bacillota bacterium]
MKIIAVETSCDDTSVAVIDGPRKVLSLKTISQNREHAKFGGVVPELASRYHANSILSVANDALSEAFISIDEIDSVAVTVTPGLVGPLLVGLSFAKGVAIALDIPIVGVNHLYAHALANLIENADLSPPFLCLIVSGGNTSIVDVIDYVNFRTISKTLDDAVGEVFDKVARKLGISYPGGPTLDNMAKKGKFNVFKMPKPKIANYNFSFSGIKTWAINIIDKLSSMDEKNDLAASLVHGISIYVTEILIKIAKKLGRTKIAIGGGVASSFVLRTYISKECKINGFDFFYPSLKYCTDNAAMIGVQGFYNLKYSKNFFDPDNL